VISLSSSVVSNRSQSFRCRLFQSILHGRALRATRATDVTDPRSGEASPSFNHTTMPDRTLIALARVTIYGLASSMAELQEMYDDAMGDFSMTDYDSAINKMESILAIDPNHFEAQLALGMAYYRKGDFPRSVIEGHKAEKMKPHEQLVHTNLSLFYMKSGDKKTAEHHGLQARVASWRGNMGAPAATGATEEDPELRMAAPKAPAMKIPSKFPEQPWKKKLPVEGAPPSGSAPQPGSEDAPKA